MLLRWENAGEYSRHDDDVQVHMPAVDVGEGNFVCRGHSHCVFFVFRRFLRINEELES